VAVMFIAISTLVTDCLALLAVTSQRPYCHFEEPKRLPSNLSAHEWSSEALVEFTFIFEIRYIPRGSNLLSVGIYDHLREMVLLRANEAKRSRQ